jgi:hypothetical protein
MYICSKSTKHLNFWYLSIIKPKYTNFTKNHNKKKMKDNFNIIELDLFDEERGMEEQEDDHRINITSLIYLSLLSTQDKGELKKEMIDLLSFTFK